MFSLYTLEIDLPSIETIYALPVVWNQKKATCDSLSMNVVIKISRVIAAGMSCASAVILRTPQLDPESPRLD